MGTSKLRWPDEWADRRKLFVVSRAMLETLLRAETTVRVVRGIPVDAHIAAVSDDFERDAIVLVAMHPTFDPVVPGEFLPQELIVLERIDG